MNTRNASVCVDLYETRERQRACFTVERFRSDVKRLINAHRFLSRCLVLFYVVWYLVVVDVLIFTEEYSGLCVLFINTRTPDPVFARLAELMSARWGVSVFVYSYFFWCVSPGEIRSSHCWQTQQAAKEDTTTSSYELQICAVFMLK